MATIRDVARVAGVSVGTVSNVVNDRGTVNGAIKRAVLQAIDDLNYRPNAAARSLRTSRTHAIALVLSGLPNPDHVAKAMLNAERVAKEHGCALLVTDTASDADDEARIIKSLLERRIDGLLSAPFASPRLIHSWLSKYAVPVVAFARSSPSTLFPSVSVDESQAVNEAAADLVGLGHRRFCVVFGGTRFWNVRRQLFRDALLRLGIPPAAIGEAQVTEPERCAELIRTRVTGETAPTALAVVAHGLVPRVLAGVRAAGKRVPADISVISFDDSDWVQMSSPALNVIEFDFGLHIHAAAQLLFQRLSGECAPLQSIVHEAEYIRRESVAPPQYSDHHDVRD